LSKLVPIGRFYGRGDEIEPVNQKWLDSYRTASSGRRTIVKPGDEVPFRGVKTLVVASDSKLLATPLPGGGPNALCATAEQKAAAGPENQNMVGTLLTFGSFRMLALIDLDWQKEVELACPINRLGTVTLYQSGRHGSFDGAGAPALLGAITPQVAVINNGPRKGLGQAGRHRENHYSTRGHASAVRAKRIRAAGEPAWDRRGSGKGISHCSTPIRSTTRRAT
jgi:hypothetical protein